MPVFNFNQYIRQDDRKILDLSDIKYKKVLVVEPNFGEFTKELNEFLASNTDIIELHLDSSLLKQLFHQPFITNICKLKIKNGWLFDYHRDSADNKLGFFLVNNPQINGIDCFFSDQSNSDNDTITYPNVALTLRYSKTHPPIAFHQMLLKHLYKMPDHEILLHNLEPDEANSLLKKRNERQNISANDSFYINIPKMKSIHSSTPINPINTSTILKALCSANFLLSLTDLLIDGARTTWVLASISIAVAGLVISTLSATPIVATAAGILSGFGLYALGRNTILPTRANAMAEYTTCISLPKF